MFWQKMQVSAWRKKSAAKEFWFCEVCARAFGILGSLGSSHVKGVVIGQSFFCIFLHLPRRLNTSVRSLISASTQQWANRVLVNKVVFFRSSQIFEKNMGVVVSVKNRRWICSLHRCLVQLAISWNFGIASRAPWNQNGILCFCFLLLRWHFLRR